MSEPAEEQPDPRTIARPAKFESGGRQDDGQNPFNSPTGTTQTQVVTSAERTKEKRYGPQS